MRLIRFISEGERMGWLWYIAYVDPCSPRYAIAPIPINFVIRLSRWLYAHIRPSWMDRMIHSAYQRGRMDGHAELSNTLRLKSIENEQCKRAIKNALSEIQKLRKL